MTYVQLAKSLRIRRNMKIILLKNQERMKKATVVAAAVSNNFDELGW
jgi:hypothetical protein